MAIVVNVDDIDLLFAVQHFAEIGQDCIFVSFASFDDLTFSYVAIFEFFGCSVQKLLTRQMRIEKGIWVVRVKHLDPISVFSFGEIRATIERKVYGPESLFACFSDPQKG